MDWRGCATRRGGSRGPVRPSSSGEVVSIREWFPRAWGNGGRWLLVAAMFFAVTFGTLAAIAAWHFIEPGPYDPLGDYPTQAVNEPEVDL